MQNVWSIISLISIIGSKTTYIWWFRCSAHWKSNHWRKWHQSPAPWVSCRGCHDPWQCQSEPWAQGLGWNFHDWRCMPCPSWDGSYYMTLSPGPQGGRQNWGGQCEHLVWSRTEQLGTCFVLQYKHIIKESLVCFTVWIWRQLHLQHFHWSRCHCHGSPPYLLLALLKKMTHQHSFFHQVDFNCTTKMATGYCKL